MLLVKEFWMNMMKKIELSTNQTNQYEDEEFDVK
jgi:plasmid maintenance system antidote protein VapI